MNGAAKRFVFGPLTIEVHVLERHADHVDYGVRIFFGDEEPFVTQFEAPKRLSSKTVAKGLLADLKDIIDYPDEMWAEIQSMAEERGFLEEGVLKGHRQVWSWVSERPDAILEAAKAAGI